MSYQPKEPANWRAVWRLIRPYWSSDEKWRARGLLFAIVALALAMVYLNVLFNSWNRDAFNALETKNYSAFKEQLWRFSYLAFIYISVAIYKVYLRQALEMRWRAWLTRQHLQEWLENQAYYRIEQTGSADNPDQRIAEDLNSLTIGTLSLALGFLSSVVTLVSFIGILWSVSGPLVFAFADHQWTIPGYMVWFAFAYALVGSVLVWWIGKPLVTQNFNQQRFEANFRFGLIRIREYAEAIALYRGEEQEQQHLGKKFEQIRANWWNIMRTTKRLNIVATFYAQFAIIFPMLVAAPRYFSGAITLGVFTQIGDAFAQVQDALSWFVDAFKSLAEWKASVNRLAGFHEAVTAARMQKSGLSVTRNNVGAILLDELSLHVPGGKGLTVPLTADVRTGQRILVSGPSGCGKSTLFRALAGVWPYGAGTIEIPGNAKLMFLPQKSYLPIGSLRTALIYPAAENAYRDLAIQHYLELCQLEHLKQSLDEVDNWSQRLSPGEQQRLAFVRVLLARPDVLFLDEATSALDAKSEDALYELILQELPQATMMSIAHREAVAKFHQTRWQFVRKAELGHTIEAEVLYSRFTIERKVITPVSSAANS
ncbi:MAG: ABC transporter ATP-binding protein/permease [Burkholderiales bacterium]|nr:ABC transporter ATP-binding protein/permease [Burkholderiales bacterium]